MSGTRNLCEDDPVSQKRPYKISYGLLKTQFLRRLYYEYRTNHDESLPNFEEYTKGMFFQGESFFDTPPTKLCKAVSTGLALEYACCLLETQAFEAVKQPLEHFREE